MKRPLFFGALALAALLVLPSSVAAATCQLTSTTTANGAGDDIHLMGTGYPADADIQIQVSRNGSAVDPVTAHTDAGGSFETVYQTGPGRGGRYTFTATTSDCTASVEAVAVETAGGGTLAGGGSGNGSASGQSLPPTSTAPATPGSPASDIALLAAVALVAAAGWVVAFAARSRRA